MKNPFIHQIGNNPARRVIILSSIHGDELSGFVILKNLIPWLKEASIEHQIEFDIFPFFNPSGIKNNSRKCLTHNLDLNRSFSLPKPPPSITKLKQLALTAKLVIDLHCFPNTRHALTALLFHDSQNVSTSAKNLKLIQSLKPSFIWKLDTTKHDSEKIGSFGPWLTSHQIPNLAIETECPEFLTSININTACNGLKQVILTAFNIISPTSKAVTISHRQVIKSPHTGIFTPLVKPGQLIIKKQSLGTITTLSNHTFSVVSPTTAPLIFIKNPIFINKSDKLAGLAIPVTT